MTPLWPRGSWKLILSAPGWVRGVVDGAQVVVGMMVHSMRGPRGQDRRPTGADLERLATHFEEAKNPTHHAAYAGHEILELLERVQGLDLTATRDRAQAAARVLSCAPGRVTHAQRCPFAAVPGLGLPDQRREHRNHIRAGNPPSALLGHGVPRPCGFDGNALQPKQMVPPTPRYVN